MHKKGMTGQVYIIVAVAVMLFACQMPKVFGGEISIAHLSNTPGALSEPTVNDLFHGIESEEQDSDFHRYNSVGSNYLVYPAAQKKNSINSIIYSMLKTKSLSVSIPLQHKKRNPELLSSDEKKVIKHLSVKTN